MCMFSYILFCNNYFIIVKKKSGHTISLTYSNDANSNQNLVSRRKLEENTKIIIVTDFHLQERW